MSQQSVRIVSLIDSPAASFAQPFEMLHACHERVERTLALLERLRRHVREHGADEQARQAARDVMRYFDLAAPQHHRDEELHVFPPLLAQADERVRELVRRLQRDHLEMESRWVAARAVLDALLQGALNALSPEQESALSAFAGTYADHIAGEEEIAYPAAAALLDEAAQAAMGEEMMRRRIG
jgi:hemerythrin-like domain-containing protein